MAASLPAPQPWRRLPSLALLGALLLGGGGLLASDLLALREADGEIAAKEALLASLRRASERAVVAAAGAEREAEESPFLPGETETIAAAALQSTVLGAIEARKASVVSAEARVRERAGPSGADGAEEARPSGIEATDRPIDLDVAFDAGIADLQAILFRLETGRPMVVVDTLRLQPARDASGKIAADPLLHAAMTAHGYWRE